MSGVVMPFRGSYVITQRWANNAWGPLGQGGHPGVDYGCPAGTPLYAIADGVVTHAGYADGFGFHCVAIWHPTLGITSLVGHGQAHYVNEGDLVVCGQHIADSGWQGFVEPPGPGGAHLHLEVRPVNSPFDGNPPNIDPVAWLYLHLQTPPAPLPAKDPIMPMPVVNSNVKLNMTAPDVQTLQGLLGARGEWISPTNTDRRILIACLRQFQATRKLTVDGICADTTWHALTHPPGSNIP